MVIIIMDLSKMIKIMDMVFISGQMEIDMKAIG